MPYKNVYLINLDTIGNYKSDIVVSFKKATLQVTQYENAINIHCLPDNNTTLWVHHADKEYTYNNTLEFDFLGFCKEHFPNLFKEDKLSPRVPQEHYQRIVND